MNNKIKLISLFLAVLLIGFVACTDDSYSLGDLTSPTELVVTADVVGKTEASPNGDGSGKVTFNFSANDALAYKVDFGDGTPVKVYSSATTVTKTYQKIGTNTFRVNVTASGIAGISTTTIKDVDVFFAYDVDPAIITNLTNDASKSWIVDKSVAAHLGVDDWNQTRASGWWWAAGINEKEAVAPCFYTSTFTFTKVSASIFSINVATPDGAFTKTGALAGIPNIPASGDEGCYDYAGATSGFSFIPSSSAIPASFPSTRVGILLEGANTFIGYASTQKEYEILAITPTYLYLRVRGTETGNAWYLKLKPKP
ncbi:MAG: PKD domain-containing protein [Lutibacter sp.]